MERWQRARKALALLVAVVLITGFVMYRAGVIGPAYMSSSKSTFVFGDNTIKPPHTTAPNEPQPAPAPTNTGE